MSDAENCRRAAVADHGRTWRIKNLTARDLRLERADGVVWVVPAFGCRAIDRDPRAEFALLNKAEALGELEVLEPAQPATTTHHVLYLYVLLVPVALCAILLWGGISGWVIAAVCLVAPIPCRVGRISFVLVNTLQPHIEAVREFLAGLPARLLQAAMFVVVLTFCLAVPAATLYYGAGMQTEVRHVIDGDATDAEYLTVVCRTMQLVLIAIAAMLPALLYYQFDRDRLSTLREKFVQQIFRLDSTLTTKRAINAKYGALIDEIYGPERSVRYRKLPPGRRAPIFVATVLMMLGWLLVLLNPDVGLMRASNGVTAEAKIAELFEPRPTAPAFAFLGAYFFTLFALLRGYVRRDLRPKSYSDISVRIVTVVILAWVLQLLFVDDSTELLVFAFLVGIVPQALLNRLREVWQQGLTRFTLPSLGDGAKDGGGPGEGTNGGPPDGDIAAALADPLPLTDLEGIDLYDRTRLSSEGVTNIEALAHHDLIELMLATRIPVPRLVDWTDQAILHLHVGAEDRATLRRYGIRTASDLLRAHEVAQDRDAFLRILGGGATDTPPRLAIMLGAIKDEEWMEHIRSWHDHRTVMSDSPLGAEEAHGTRTDPSRTVSIQKVAPQAT
jgi:hypothetical protein